MIYRKMVLTEFVVMVVVVVVVVDCSSFVCLQHRTKYLFKIERIDSSRAIQGI